MRKVHWTGHPFVDAGLAAIAAVVAVENLEDINPEGLRKGVESLKNLLLSDQALGVGVKDSFARKSMSQIFPNSELVNSSNWKGSTLEEKADSVRAKFRKVLEEELEKAQRALTDENGDEICCVCGERCPSNAMEFRRKDRMPLAASVVNYYPAFTYGLRICGICALALRFLPFSVMRTGGQGRLWFLHSQELPIVKELSLNYGWRHFSALVAANQSVDFCGGWQTAGEAGTVLYVLCQLLTELPDQTRAIYMSPLPTTAYIFSNDNRSGYEYLQALPIPNELLSFFAKLYRGPGSAFTVFRRETLEVPGNLSENESETRRKNVNRLAKSMISGEPLLGMCLDHKTSRLLGGWTGHRLYIKEVRKMEDGKLAALERLGVAIAQDEDAKKHISRLVSSRPSDLYGLMLSYVKRGWLNYEEYYGLLPPNDHKSLPEIRDILLAVIYEWQHCREKGLEFVALPAGGNMQVDGMLRRIEEIGGKLLDSSLNLKRWLADLSTARLSDQIRRAYLNAVRKGAITYHDFIFLAPMGDRKLMWLLRDYLLAFLFDRGRAELDSELFEGIEELETPEFYDGGAF